MLVFAMMTICFAVQQLGKKINPFVLAWHIQQWLAHAKPKKASTKSNSGSSASPSDRDRDDAASVHTAPGSGGKSKAAGGSGGSTDSAANPKSKAGGSGSGGSTDSKAPVRPTFRPQRSYCGFNKILCAHDCPCA